jgi:hypothetical protein
VTIEIVSTMDNIAPHLEITRINPDLDSRRSRRLLQKSALSPSDRTLRSCESRTPEEQEHW